MTWSSSSKPLSFALTAALLASSPYQPAGSAVPQLRLSLPVLCDMHADCSIQKYVDRAPGPERLDYRCGNITTDGHDGLDLRLRRVPDLRRDVPVVAAADGTVLRVRDGMPDISAREAGAASIGERLAGNGLVIDHGGGWETQYSHLKRGSLRVRPGDKVRAGTALGAIGMSGNAEFPHLHFEVRRDQKTVDPFAPGSIEGCGSRGATLWSSDALSKLAYREADVLAAGFADHPSRAATARGEQEVVVSIKDPATLLLWGVATGAKDGDEQHFRITGPSGAVILDRKVRIVRGGLDWVGYAGLRRPAAGWAAGSYAGSYALIRNGKSAGSVTARTSIQTSK